MGAPLGRPLQGWKPDPTSSPSPAGPCRLRRLECPNLSGAGLEGNATFWWAAGPAPEVRVAGELLAALGDPSGHTRAPSFAAHPQPAFAGGRGADSLWAKVRDPLRPELAGTPSRTATLSTLHLPAVLSCWPWAPPGCCPHPIWVPHPQHPFLWQGPSQAAGPLEPKGTCPPGVSGGPSLVASLTQALCVVSACTPASVGPRGRGWVLVIAAPLHQVCGWAPSKGTNEEMREPLGAPAGAEQV